MDYVKLQKTLRKLRDNGEIPANTRLSQRLEDLQTIYEEYLNENCIDWNIITYRPFEVKMADFQYFQEKEYLQDNTFLVNWKDRYPCRIIGNTLYSYCQDLITKQYRVAEQTLEETKNG